MSKLKQYQDTYVQSAQQALQRMGNTLEAHGYNQNGDPLRQYQNQTNEAQRVVEVVNNSPPKPKIGEGALMNMWNKGRDEIGHATRAFHDPDTVPVAPSYLDSSRSPLKEMQQELHVPAMEQQKEIER